MLTCKELKMLTYSKVVVGKRKFAVTCFSCEYWRNTDFCSEHKKCKNCKVYKNAFSITTSELKNWKLRESLKSTYDK